MEEKTWTVVQFLDDLTVEAIPSSWIQGNNCHWPSTFPTEKLMNAIKRSEPLNTCWPTHPIKIFRKATFGNYLKARNKARIAETTSDINSEPDTENKRKRIQKILSSSDESFEDSTLPLPPQISKSNLVNKNFENKQYQPKNDDVIVSKSDVWKNLEVGESSNNEAVQDVAIFNSLQLEQNTTTCKNCHCKDCLKKDGIQKNLVQQYHILRGILTEVLAETKSIRKELNRNTTERAPMATSFFTQAGCQFPLDSDEDLQGFEEFLNQQENLQNAIAELSKVGGSNTYSFVSRALKLVITNELALQYSWLGRKGKKVFSTLKLATLIIESAIVAVNSSRKEIETSVQLWIIGGLLTGRNMQLINLFNKNKSDVAVFLNKKHTYH